MRRAFQRTVSSVAIAVGAGDAAAAAAAVVAAVAADASVGARKPALGFGGGDDFAFPVSPASDGTAALTNKTKQKKQNNQKR